MVDRTPIPEQIAAEVLFSANRTCCVCTTPGKKIQIHHIDDNPSNHDPANLAVLCLECHGDTQLKGGFGRHLNGAQVTLFRDKWNEIIRKRREAAAAFTALPKDPPRQSSPTGPPEIPPQTGLFEYVRTLPQLRRLAYEAARPKWDTGVTARMMEGNAQLLDALVAIVMTLARYYPEGHFDGDDPRDYFSELIASRYRWHRHHLSTAGEGHSGSIVGPSAGGQVIGDVENMIDDMVASLTLAQLTDEKFPDYSAWKRDWKAGLNW